MWGEEREGGLSWLERLVGGERRGIVGGWLRLGRGVAAGWHGPSPARAVEGDPVLSFRAQACVMATWLSPCALWSTPVSPCTGCSQGPGVGLLWLSAVP